MTGKCDAKFMILLYLFLRNRLSLRAHRKTALNSTINILFHKHMPSIVLHYVIIASITIVFVLVNKIYGHKGKVSKERHQTTVYHYSSRKATH
ncbi:hypothetical protein BW716_09190 [[Flexibacter] sp. ATCC 35208]|nr:hypothetical protein BW716_09190 [[Flexibacter] sp. ATCC 35208]